ncbi:ESPR-type extended signal peptide-containing protein [Veillonella sp. 20925_1_51]|uniref:ESPR-type extended signal peptide-containing protein n=1 Tax=Veillonella sp. 20925_1_51 TaxID=3003641 RepID=UPI00352DBCDC
MNKIFKVVWNAKKGCNVVTSEKAKSTSRFQGSTRLAAMAILGLTVITSGVNTASAEGATTTVGTIEVNTSNNLTYIGGHLQPGTNLTAMDSNTYSISGTIANPTSMAFNGNTNTTAYIYANGQLIPDTSFVANGTEQATSTRNITKMWNDSGTVDGNGNYIHSTSPVKKAAQISPVETKQTVISSPGKAQKGTIKTEVLGTTTTTTTGKTVTISKLSDNLAFANIGGLAEAGSSTMASYDLMLDDITQAALNEHAKAINTLTELAVDAQNDKQTAFVDANGNKVVKTTDSTGTTEGYYLESDIDSTTGKAKVGASTVAHTDIHVSLLDASGSTTTPTKLSNIADGTVAANSKEAVNGGQLFDVKTTAEAANTAVTTKGIKFDGDTGTTITRKLDETLNIKGNTATSAVLTDGNIGVVSDGTDTLLVKLARNIDLGTNGSVTTGNAKISNAGLTSKDAAGNTTVVNGSGLSFTDNTGAAIGPSITKDGINAGNKTVSNVATAVNGTDAVNKAQLDAAIAAIPTTGGATTLKTAADNSTTGTVALGTQSLAVNGTANYVTTTANGNAITVDLAQSIKDKINTAATVAGNGKDGRDGSNGTAGASITGPTGKDGLNGKDLTDKTHAIRNGEAGIIVYTNDAGERLVKANDGNYYKAAEVNADGTTVAGATAVTNPVASLVNPDGTTTGATTKLTNVADGTVAANSKEAVNGGQLFDVKTIADAANTTVTTKGIKFDGDTGTTITRKLDETLNIKGNTATSAVLTDGNIGVVSYGTDTLLVKLAQKINLGTAGSVTMGNTAISNAGVTSKDIAGNTTVVNGSGVSFKDSTDTATGPSITKDGINAGNKTVSNVATAVNGTDAVNKAQLDAAIAAIPTTGGASTLKTAADNSTTGTVALGTQSLAVNGTANYVTTTANGNAITVDLAQSIKDKINTAATVAGNGKDGRDGSNGTAGASITGPTGKDGLNGKDLTDKTNAIRNGEAGIIVYTNDAGERLEKANDGNYYKAADVNADGTTVAGATAVTSPVASLVNPDGTTTGATTKLTNVADGTVAANSKEAVNGGQLFDVKQNITNLTNTVNSGLTFKGDTGTQFNRALGTTVNVVGGTTGNGTTNNVVVTANGTDTLTVKLAENIDLGTNGSVTTGNTKISNAGLTSKDTTGNTTVVNGSGLSFTDNTGAATGPSITKDGINAGGKIISNVATAVNGTDAVNLTQVQNMISGIGGGAQSKVTEGDNIKVTESPDTATNGKVFNVALKDSISVTNVTTTDAAGNTTVTNGNGVTITGASSPTNPGKTVSLSADGLNNGGNQIHNVAPGISANDAATVGQVQAALSGVNSAFNGLDSKINTTGANAAALAGLKPIQYDPLEPTQIMAAYGHYHNKSAVAVGVAHFTDESTMLHAGVTLDDQNNMFNVGVTKKVGSSTAKKAIPERYKGGPISSIYVMNDEITALKEENARIKQENEETKAKLAMVMEKLGL